MRLAPALALVAFTASRAATQAAGVAPPEVSAIVVRVHALQTDGTRENGAGVIIATGADAVYVLTARHVVAKEFVDDSATVFEPATATWISFFSFADSLPATAVLLDSAYLAPAVARLATAVRTGNSAAVASARQAFQQDSALIAGYDLAVLRVDLRATPGPPGWTPPPLDRLGDPHALLPGDDVIPMGCPRGVCWIPPVPPDKFVLAEPGEVVLQTISVAPGSSGGALFNANWEVVGILRDTRVPRASAVPIDEAARILARARIPVQLHPPRLPRDGYHLHADLMLLANATTAASPDSLARAASLPSGRLTISRRGRSPLTWHASALYLAPYNTVVKAALGGLAYALRAGAFTASPFAELGLGSVDSRYDRGGYHTARSPGTPAAYVPLWTAESVSGVGVGAGLTAGYFIAPHWSISMSAAHWSFEQPPNAPAFPGLFIGGGLRWSR